ncbi:MAG: hypothetical protein PHV82_18260, partial [Victivallaceae bacterium]|nr:hypothetical protein [Victivallaceae bacterium]
MYNIECFAVFKRAFRRMTVILFRPFDIGKWLVLGFSAWLATMFNSAGFKFQSSERIQKITPPVRDIFLGDGSFVGRVCGYFKIEESIFWLIVFGTIALILFVIAVSLLIIWISSRFKFIFIDNIANNRAAISQSWTKFKEPGNSAFRWFFAWGVACCLFLTAIFIIAASVVYPLLIEYLRTEDFHISGIDIFILTLTATAYVLGGLFLLFALYFFNEFVLLIMYKRNMHARSAWRIFLKLLNAVPLTFLKFFILQIFAAIACFMAVFLFVICTCCITLIPLAIPYLGSV